MHNIFNWSDDDFSILLNIWLCMFSLLVVYFVMDIFKCLTFLSQCNLANTFYDVMRLGVGLTMLFWVTWWGWVLYDYYND